MIQLRIFVFLLIGAILFACSDEDDAIVNPVDNTAPSAITTLRVIGNVDTTCILMWLAPGDDGTEGTASEYDIRYSTDSSTLAGWTNATQVIDELSPSSAGQAELYAIDNLQPDSNYYFAIKTVDDGDNISQISNIVTEPILPEPYVEILSPIEGESIGDAIWITAAASDDKGITRVEFYGNGSLIGSDAMPPYLIVWKDNSSSHGETNTFYAQAYDTDGNMGGSHAVNCYTDTTMFYPAASNILQMSNITDSSVDLIWSSNGDIDFRSYAVLYDTVAFTEGNAEFASLVINSKIDTTLTLTGLLDSVTYYFSIRTADEYFQYSFGNQLPATTDNAPPDIVVFSVPYYSSEIVALAWEMSQIHDFGSYKLYRSVDETVDTNDELLVTYTNRDSLTHIDSTVVNGNVYYYGLIIEDIHGASKLSGTIRIDVTYKNYALDFDGYNDYCKVPHFSELDFSTELTIEAWVYPHQNGAYLRIVDKTESVCCLQYNLLINNGRVGIDIGTQQTSTWWRRDGSATVPTNTWSHVAVTYNSGELCYYINGVLDMCESIPLTSLVAFPTDLHFGRRNMYDEFYFDGMIDEIRMWNVARTQSEIASTYQAFLTGMETGLVGYWRFDEGAGDSSIAIVGNNCHLGGHSVPDSHDPIWVESTVPISK